MKEFKNPYSTSKAAISATETGEGFVNVTDDGSDVTIETCFAETGTGDAKACVFAPTDGYEASSTSNKVSIE